MNKDDFNEYKRQLEEMESEDSFFYKYASEKELRKQKKKKSKKMKKLAKKAEKYKKSRRNQKRKERLKAEKDEQKAIRQSEKELKIAEKKANKEAKKAQNEKSFDDTQELYNGIYESDFTAEDEKEMRREKKSGHSIRYGIC